ncbi:MAG: hypothetical protein HYW57_04405 [Ignavibacteriales bacterium]|nr:hypothetical protein [Ignavibacteriales bacterium]
MKQFIALVSFFFVPLNALAQDHYLWLKLSENRVILNATWRGMEGDSLQLLSGGKSLFVPIEEIEQIRVMREGSIVEGAAVGAGIGLAVGMVAGFLARPVRDQNRTMETSALYIGIVGGIIGSVAGSLRDMEQAVPLEGKSVAEKRETIGKLIAAP